MFMRQESRGGSGVEIHHEFTGMGAFAQVLDIPFGFVPDPGIDDIFGEDIAARWKS
ncbi:MAG: hypothetical protein R3C12_02260 [Planctomycetaceae bacterium]